MSVVTREKLKADFENFLAAGMKIAVHSSLSSLGYVEGGATEVIMALTDIITSSGLIMMPTFTYGRQPYDPDVTISYTGIIPETFRKMGGVERSCHPTHSYCAWGRGAKDILSGHEVEEPFKKGTPLEKFARQGGFVVLLGVTHAANSLIHVAQEAAQLPYLNRPKKVLVKKGAGFKEVIARRAGCSLGFDKIAPFLGEDDLVRKYTVAEAEVLFMNANDVLVRGEKTLKENPFLLDCGNPDCFACNEMRAFKI
ncbi:AAC(3) family N-acetyltransferase [bacterium]|nr:MAG: AAC(3) family N-acetyltransferase [bacterium]